MTTNQQNTPNEDGELLKKVLMLELFKLGVSQDDIGRKLKIKREKVTDFLRGIKKQERNDHGKNG